MTASRAPSSTGIALPVAIQSIEDTGLPFAFVSDLVLKTLYFTGSMLGRDLSNHLCLPFPVIETALKFLADEGYISAAGVQTSVLSRGEAIGAGMQYFISSAGRQRTREILMLNQYAGPAPVTIEDYRSLVEQQSSRGVVVNRQMLKDACKNIVVTDKVLDGFGPALNAGHATFVYGPPGNGKTTIVERIAPLLGDPIFVPRALYVQGEVIRFFDPLHHAPITEELPDYDMRWQLVERPVVKVGGELIPEMLDLRFDPTLGFYEASLQMKANGGIFFIDDFGRQQYLSPAALLNRLIVPLENGIDYVNVARIGTSVAVPFTCQLILSTNLQPQNLMDEAFLRRVRFKVHVDNPTVDEYREIWKTVCKNENIKHEPASIEYLIQEHYMRSKRAFHGVHPRDLLNHLIHIASYLGVEPTLSHELIDAACRTYFVDVD
ncbi:MAG: ATP-binding protein [Candidatus Dormibacteria bacterium]